MVRIQDGASFLFMKNGQVVVFSQQIRGQPRLCRAPKDPVTQIRGLSPIVPYCLRELASVSSPAEQIRTSDIALYEAKRCGRNQIVAAPKTTSDLDRVSKGARIENC